MSRYENHIETGLGRKRGFFKVCPVLRCLYNIQRIGSRKYLKLFGQTLRYSRATGSQPSLLLPQSGLCRNGSLHDFLNPVPKNAIQGTHDHPPSLADPVVPFPFSQFGPDEPFPDKLFKHPFDADSGQRWV
jgi:hypothetical protein